MLTNRTRDAPMQAFRSGGTIAFNQLGQWRQWLWGQLIFKVDGGGVVIVSSARISCFMVVIVIWLALCFWENGGNHGCKLHKRWQFEV